MKSPYETLNWFYLHNIPFLPLAVRGNAVNCRIGSAMSKQDNILKDFEIYYAIKILTGKIKLEYPKEDYEILGIYKVDTRLKVKIFKTTLMGGRKDKV